MSKKLYPLPDSWRKYFKDPDDWKWYVEEEQAARLRAQQAQQAAQAAQAAPRLYEAAERAYERRARAPAAERRRAAAVERATPPAAVAQLALERLELERLESERALESSEFKYKDGPIIKYKDIPVSNGLKVPPIQNAAQAQKEDDKKLIDELKSQLAAKIKELDDLQQISENQKSKIEQLNDEILRLKRSQSSTQPQKGFSLQILDDNALDELETIEELDYNNNGKILKVAKKAFYVLKVMNTSNKTHQQFKQFIKEYEIMNMLEHPNILKAFGIYLSSKNRPPSILLEFCKCNLEAAINDKLFSNVDIAFVIYQIAEGMKYVHKLKIIHRNLKPTNILIATDGTIKISDFGISKLMTPEEITMTMGAGTQKFMAPEIINEVEYNEKVDVYSFGVLVFYILSGGKMPKITVTQIGTGKKAEIPSDFTQSAKDLINECWNFNPADRPSFEDICRKLILNAGSLLNFTNQETKNVNDLIKNHQQRIPPY